MRLSSEASTCRSAKAEPLTLGVPDTGHWNHNAMPHEAHGRSFAGGDFPYYAALDKRALGENEGVSDHVPGSIGPVHREPIGAGLPPAVFFCISFSAAPGVITSVRQRLNGGSSRV